MELDEFMWRKKLTVRSFSEILGCCALTVHNARNKKVSPKMLLAYKIMNYTDGCVTLDELLSTKDIEEIKKIKMSIHNRTNAV